MNAQSWVSLLIPATLAIIMFGMGMTLHISDFARVTRYPKAASIGLSCQLLLLPVIAGIIIYFVPMRAEFAVGLMLIALSPGGAISNLFSLLARGDIALSVTMTAISSSVCVVTVPLLLNFGLPLLMKDSVQISLPVIETMKQIAYITIIPVSLGMTVNAVAPGMCRKLATPFKVLSMAFLSIAVVLILLREQDRLLELLTIAGPAAILLNVVAMALGATCARLAAVSATQRRTLVIEVGAQNAILATAIAVSPTMLHNTTIAMVPTIYGFTMLLILGAYLALLASTTFKSPTDNTEAINDAASS